MTPPLRPCWLPVPAVPAVRRSGRSRQSRRPRRSGRSRRSAAVRARGPGEGFDRGVLILWNTPAQSGAAPGPGAAGAGPAFRAMAAAHGWRVIECSPEPGPGVHPGIVLGRRGALIRTGSPPVDFVPDLVPAEVFDRFCRGFSAARRTPATPPPAIPQHCSLADVLPLAAQDISRRWSRSGAEAGLGAPVGAGSRGDRADRSEGRRSALPGRGDHGFREVGVLADSCRRPRGQPSAGPGQPALHRFQGRLRPWARSPGSRTASAC